MKSQTFFLSDGKRNALPAALICIVGIVVSGIPGGGSLISIFLEAGQIKE
jgi:hypothetical protein